MAGRINRNGFLELQRAAVVSEFEKAVGAVRNRWPKISDRLIRPILARHGIITTTAALAWFERLDGAGFTEPESGPFVKRKEDPSRLEVHFTDQLVPVAAGDSVTPPQKTTNARDPAPASSPIPPSESVPAATEPVKLTSGRKKGSGELAREDQAFFAEARALIAKDGFTPPSAGKRFYKQGKIRGQSETAAAKRFATSYCKWVKAGHPSIDTN